MSHRKAHSQGSIPFSWEEKPGVCKTPNNIGQSLQVRPNNQTTHDTAFSLSQLEKKIPLPPCPSQHHPHPLHRSTSGKGFKSQQDPFLIAYKECTKSEKNDQLFTENKKCVGSNFSLWRCKYYIFSCRNASDVRDDSYLKISQFPHLPSHRNRSLTLQDMSKNQASTMNHGYDLLY
ncbi:hypothetical protein Lalb_Chr09g0335521 [Lupinus albus]|uniref:Uncharacterized protein n=1 Tax=Lupinus albus TaxID=3870 RepID=A0A6A4Q2X3_LUPAL|nr:hypothetical protein Lalb_Chr09g0335521 [Lupinus albus]